jgi:hypothetical protein
VGSRYIFKIAAIRERIEFCEAEQRQLLKMVTTSSQVNLAWIAERMEKIQRELRFLYHDLEQLKSEEWN